MAASQHKYTRHIFTCSRTSTHMSTHMETTLIISLTHTPCINGSPFVSFWTLSVYSLHPVTSCDGAGCQLDRAFQWPTVIWLFVRLSVQVSVGVSMCCASCVSCLLSVSRSRSVWSRMSCLLGSLSAFHVCPSRSFYVSLPFSLSTSVSVGSVSPLYRSDKNFTVLTC